MVRSLSAANLAALEQRQLVARDFLSLWVRDRTTGEIVYFGMWSDLGTITAEVINPDTGATVSRAFVGSGTLIQISDLALVANITVQTVSITMSQVEEYVEALVREYDPKQGRVEIFRGLFDPSTRQMVAPATSRFVGFIDKVEIKTPSENEEGGVVLTCVSHTQEMTRSNPDTRSHESQKRRSATDTFFKDASVVGDWEQKWGNAEGSVRTQKKGLFGWGNFLGFL